jgi:hypothetical protein
MNRRSFLSRIARAVAVAVAAPVILREAIQAQLPVATEPFWYQTTRVSRCVDSEYEAFFRKVHSEMFEGFELSVTEYQKRVEGTWT